MAQIAIFYFRKLICAIVKHQRISPRLQDSVLLIDEQSQKMGHQDTIKKTKSWGKMITLIYIHMYMH